MDSDLQRELNGLVHRWRSDAGLFSDDDKVARRMANKAADDLQEVMDDYTEGEE